MTNIKNDVCDICYTYYSNKNIACSMCKKQICLDCCNRLPSRAFSIKPHDENGNRITKNVINPTDKCVASFVWDCPFCRETNIKRLYDLTKNEIITFINIDYLSFTKIWDEKELYKQTLIKIKERTYTNIYYDDELISLREENIILKEKLIKIKNENKLLSNSIHENNKEVKQLRKYKKMYDKVIIIN